MDSGKEIVYVAFGTATRGHRANISLRYRLLFPNSMCTENNPYELDCGFAVKVYVVCLPPEMRAVAKT